MKTEQTNQTCINAKTFGQMLSLSKRQIFRLNSCGKIPSPIRIGGAVRWKMSDVQRFIQSCNCDIDKFKATIGE